MSETSGIGDYREPGGVRASRYAVIALNLAIVIVVSTAFLLNEFQDVEQSRSIAEYHLPVAHTAESATHELAHLEYALRAGTTSPQGAENGQITRAERDARARVIDEQLNTLQEIQRALARLHNAHPASRFTEVAELTDRAFTVLAERVRSAAAGTPDQAVLDAVALLELRLNQLEGLNLAAAERLLKEDSPFYEIGERTLLLLFVVLVVSVSLVTAGIVRRLEQASAQRSEAVGRMRQATGRLALLADRLERAQRIAKIGNWAWDAGGSDQWWSDEAYRLLGIDPQSKPPGNEALMETVHPSDRAWVLHEFTESEKKGTGYDIRYRIVVADGTERVVHEIAEPVHNENGEFVGQRGTIQDITEQYLAERKLRETAQRLEAALRLARLGTWEWNPDGNMLRLSEETAKIWGLGSDVREITYEHVNAMIHKEDIAGTITLIENTAATGEPYTYEYRLIRPDGAIRTVVEHAERFTDETTGKVMVHGTIQDVTDSKRIQEELASLNADLEARVEARTAELREAQEDLVKSERLATLGQLTATVSHELRNPLGAMRASMYVIEKRVDTSDERTVNAIERVNRNITRCDHIIDELLDFTRIRKLKLQPIGIDDWLAGVLDEQPVPKGVQVLRKFGAPGLKVPADPDRLHRAIINLYDNACQALAAAGQGTASRSKQVRIETRLCEDRLEIVFSDNGPGVPEDLLDKVFEPLFSTKNFGVGLGLPTVEQIMRQHGGGVTVGARRGGGATFALWLPLTAETETADP